MVIVDVSGVCDSTDEIIEAMKARGILCAPWGKGLLRLVTHHQVRMPQVEQVIQAFAAFAADRPRCNGSKPAKIESTSTDVAW